MTDLTNRSSQTSLKDWVFSQVRFVWEKLVGHQLQLACRQTYVLVCLYYRGANVIANHSSWKHDAARVGRLMAQIWDEHSS